MATIRLPESQVVNVVDLVRSGRAAAAVQVLEHAGFPDAAGAVGLAKLSAGNESFLASVADVDTNWPPQAGSMLAPVGELPEVSAEDLDVATLTDGVIGSGALIVRGLITDRTAAELRGRIDDVMAARDRIRAGEAAASDSSWYTRHDPTMSSFLTEHNVYVCDSPRMVVEVADLYERLGIVELMRQYLREPPSVSLRKWVLRRVPAGANTGWHQDGNFMGENTRNMNMWLGLSDNGVDAPGLDLVPLRLNHIVESGTGDADFDWSVGSQTVQELLGQHSVIRPDLKAGDAVFFDHMCLHRTGVSPEMTKTRYAIESWFFTPSHFPADYKGFLL